MNRLGRPLALVFAILVTALATAPPSTATTIFKTRDPSERTVTILHVESQSRVSNRVSVTFDRPPTVDRPSTYVISDPRERMRPRRNAGCNRLTAHKVRCGATDLLNVGLGSGDDSVRTSDKRYGRPSFYAPSIFSVAGEGGEDSLVSRHGSLHGGRGDDVIRGLGSLNGGPGDDRIRGGRTKDLLQGGEGNDVLQGGRQRDELYGGYYVSPEPSGGGRDRLDGGSGNDLFEDGDRMPGSRNDADRLIGGRGDDSVSYNGARKRVFVNLTRPGGAGEPGEDDVITGMEKVEGGRAADYLVGDSDLNFFRGGAGKDVVRARGGDDEIWVEDADDVRGQLGADEIRVFGPAAAELGCGGGEDTVTGEPVPHPDPRGVLIPSDCERVRVRTYSSQGAPEKIAIGPVPELPAADELRFAIFNFSCCEYRLAVTEPVDPFAELGSAPIHSDRISVPLPAETADRARQERVELRAALYGSAAGPVLMWRFVPEAP